MVPGVYICLVPSASTLASFLVLALVVIVVPGPSVVFVISRAMILGTKGAIQSVLGNAAGVGVQIVAVSLGVGVLIASSPMMFALVKTVVRCSWCISASKASDIEKTYVWSWRTKP